ncbi:MAG TPA: SUMF1/EgtB/PvdO family nonheme iron enzyme [Polyangiaceae bacterium]|nr:SUMF1/EgtB/PvdO family nonheme iron enzyme [Polyangiaceae bacterium]
MFGDAESRVRWRRLRGVGLGRWCALVLGSSCASSVSGAESAKPGSNLGAEQSQSFAPTATGEQAPEAPSANGGSELGDDTAVDVEGTPTSADSASGADSALETANRPRKAQPVEPNAASNKSAENHKSEAKGSSAGESRADDKTRAHSSKAIEHCPSGMVFIDGDYCSEVEHRCTKQWHSDANDKDICEDFEPWSKCVGGKEHKSFCIDDYSWPNKVGERPEVMNNFYQAQVKCAAVGKRLCTESEWTMACEGPEMKPFPYGYVRDPNICNGDREWDHPDMNKVAKRDPHELARLWQGVRSGSQPYCVSDYGVHDLPGNDDEVVSSETVSSSFRGKFDSVHTGGPWYKGVRNQCRPKIYTHNEGFYYYYLSFRCCSAPDGAVNDPRAPKQIKRDMPFSRVESLARFTTAQMQKKLEAKAQGKCTCKAEDTLCKTMCGTLLGPEAKDAELGTPRTRPAKTTGSK